MHFFMTNSVNFSKSSFYMTEKPSNGLHDTLIRFKIFKILGILALWFASAALVCANRRAELLEAPKIGQASNPSSLSQLNYNHQP